MPVPTPGRGKRSSKKLGETFLAKPDNKKRMRYGSSSLTAVLKFASAAVMKNHDEKRDRNDEGN